MRTHGCARTLLYNSSTHEITYMRIQRILCYITDMYVTGMWRACMCARACVIEYKGARKHGAKQGK